MPRGLPDYYNPDTIVSQRLANVEEVVTAVRGIGSIDNRGRTLFFDPFHETIKGWELLKSGDGEYPVLAAYRVLIPPSSAYFDTGTSGGDGLSQLMKRFHLGASTRLGFEAHILHNVLCPNYKLRMFYDLGGVEFTARLEFLPATGALRIFVSNNWVEIGNTGYGGYSGEIWLPLKLVADFESGQYVRALMGQEQIDLSSYSMDSSLILPPGIAAFDIRCEAANAGENSGFAGFANITVDEP